MTMDSVFLIVDPDTGGGAGRWCQVLPFATPVSFGSAAAFYTLTLLSSSVPWIGYESV